MKKALIVATLAALYGCANQTTPTGGPKDETPPKLISITPAHKSINTRPSSIELLFDEDVVVNNPKEQIIITPYLGKDVELTTRKQKATLKINATFKDSTTYTINFRDAIKDLTEGNPAQNLKLAFSTGSYLDSLLITGHVTDLIRNALGKNMVIGLYQNADTFNIFTDQPLYSAKSSASGKFLIENLPPENYYIYAFDDKNKNLVVDSKTEGYGFIKEIITPKTDTLAKITIGFIKLDARKLAIISARPYNTYYAVKINKGVKEYNITATDTTDTVYSVYNAAQSTFNIYPQKHVQDSIPIQFSATDSLDMKVDTLLYLKQLPKPPKQEQLTQKIDRPLIIESQALFKCALSFNKPITHILLDSIKIQLDSTTYLSIEKNDVITTNSTAFVISKKIDKKLLSDPTASTKDQKLTTQNLAKGASLSKGKNIKFIIGKGALVSVENDTVPRSESQVSIYKPEDTSIILAETDTQEPYFIIQLVDRNLTVIREVTNTKQTTFSDIIPGEYQLRVIVDSNNNQRWDPGNFRNRTEPEKIFYYKSEGGLQNISLKPNWELGPLLITTSQNVNNSK